MEMNLKSKKILFFFIYLKYITYWWNQLRINLNIKEDITFIYLKYITYSCNEMSINLNLKRSYHSYLFQIYNSSLKLDEDESKYKKKILVLFIVQYITYSWNRMKMNLNRINAKTSDFIRELCVLQKVYMETIGKCQYFCSNSGMASSVRLHFEFDRDIDETEL